MKLPNISSATAGNCRQIRRVEGAPAEPFAAKRGVCAGNWIFEIWQGNRRLAMQVFKVITSTPDDGKVITSTADVSAITRLPAVKPAKGFEGANRYVMD